MRRRLVGEDQQVSATEDCDTHDIVKVDVGVAEDIDLDVVEDVDVLHRHVIVVGPRLARDVDLIRSR